MKIQWEYDLVERPFFQQLTTMGWTWLEGDVDVPELTERTSFREVLLKNRLAAAIRKINLRNGQPWLDDERIARVIRDLEQAAGHRLIEINQSATELLLKGTVVDGLPDWDNGRPQPVRFIDFENPANNDFLVINQFKVELTSGRGHIIPDAVLFVNGIPLVLVPSLRRRRVEPSGMGMLLVLGLGGGETKSAGLQTRKPAVSKFADKMPKVGPFIALWQPLPRWERTDGHQTGSSPRHRGCL